jgi:hypothetical protein
MSAMSKFLVGTARATLLCATIAVAPGAALAAEPFASPEAAVEALVSAVQAGDGRMVIGIFGEGSEDLVLTGVDEVDRRNWTSFAQAYEVASKIVVEDTAATLYIGAEQWPFPVSLRKTEDSWEFDTDAARDEILFRRIGENELTAIGVLRSYIRAQYEYFARDRDGDGVLEFAQSILSAAGARDGLYYPVDEGEPESPFGPAIAVATAEGYSYADAEQPAEPEPYYGYYFRVLDRQGPTAPGGAFDYVINSNMVAGFGMIAFPADYAVSGVMSFMVGRNGEIYERDLGTETVSIAAEIEEFDPKPGWEPVAED